MPTTKKKSKSNFGYGKSIGYSKPKKTHYGYGYSKSKLGYGYSKTKSGNVKTTNQKHKNEFSLLNCFPKMWYTDLERKLIFENIKEHSGILYGSTSASLQSPFPMSRKPFTDSDILVHQPKKFAQEVERELDIWAGHDCYYLQELQTDSGVVFRIINRCRGDQVVCDVSPMKKHPPTRKFKGMRVETLKSREKEIRRMLKDPNAVYRRKKDLQNLGYVVRYRKEQPWR